MARPLRFRRSTERWHLDRVRQQLLSSLDQNIGAEMGTPHYRPPNGWEGVRFDMDNGDIALFVWSDDEAYWLGNTETPSALWRTNKFEWEQVPYPIARWAQRELLADLRVAEPWLAKYPHVCWYFLPVLMSKDGRESTREFFRDYACGFPDADRDEALSYLESVLHPGTLDDYRHEMAGKLGTSQHVDRTRMASAISEFVAAKVLTDAGYDVTPEIEVTTGHFLDYRAKAPDGTNVLVEVTRPRSPSRRSANTPVAAVRDTAQVKTSGQLANHGGGVVMFVDCSNFLDDQWAAVRGEQPDVRHKPAVVYRVRPDGQVEGYQKGDVPLDLDGVVEWV
ncbi:DUF5784 family protein [Haloarchaeobius sp. DYHT-AS-18]|uniref:DUF5784 family protein n=1 Tax=Haloarchaeobius sp. DYHT-AS-18 TaxID=3446117 RepID=UPI003EBD9622